MPPKEMLIDAIIGKGFAGYNTCDYYTRIGLARPVGNPWNHDWAWDREALEKLLGVPEDVRAPEPSDYDDECPTNYPPAEGIDMVRR